MSTLKAKLCLHLECSLFYLVCRSVSGLQSLTLALQSKKSRANLRPNLGEPRLVFGGIIRAL